MSAANRQPSCSYLRRRCNRREKLFDLAYPLAQRAANVRASSAPRYDYLDRDDLVQDALSAVFEALDRYDEPRARLRTFVEKVAGNGIASTLRRARASKRNNVDGLPLVEPPALSLTVELRVDSNRALRTMSPDRQVAAPAGRLLPGGDCTYSCGSAQHRLSEYQPYSRGIRRRWFQ